MTLIEKRKYAVTCIRRVGRGRIRFAAPHNGPGGHKESIIEVKHALYYSGGGRSR